MERRKDRVAHRPFSSTAAHPAPFPAAHKGLTMIKTASSKLLLTARDDLMSALATPSPNPRAHAPPLGLQLSQHQLALAPEALQAPPEAGTAFTSAAGDPPFYISFNPTSPLLPTPANPTTPVCTLDMQLRQSQLALAPEALQPVPGSHPSMFAWKRESPKHPSENANSPCWPVSLHPTMPVRTMGLQL